MKFKPEKKKKAPKTPQSLEYYLLAAENPVGRRQLRPIFRRKRNGEVLTREQVAAIKRGRRLLRKEMKERGLKRRIDYEIMASNLGLSFDRGKLMWPFFLWLIKDNTVAKILATTAVLTTVVTVTEPVVEYVTQFVTQYVQQMVQQIVQELVPELVPDPFETIREKDRFTISLSDEMLTKGLELSPDNSFADPKEVLTCVPAWDMSCISISQIPSAIQNFEGGENHDIYFAYTFYCRYVNLDAEKALRSDKELQDSVNVDGMEAMKPMLENYTIDYDWGVMIGNESLDDDAVIPENDPDLKVSDAIWIMVLEDDRVILSAKGRDDGSVEVLPTDKVLQEKSVAYMDRSMDYIDSGLGNIHPLLNHNTVGNMDELFEGGELEYYRDEVNTYLDKNVTSLTKLMLYTDDPDVTYQAVPGADRGSYSYYRVYPEAFESDEVVMQQHRTEVLPYLRPEQFKGTSEQLQEILETQQKVHKYTVIIWLEGDDPECVNALMNGHISLNFQIKGDEEDFRSEVITNTEPTEPEESTQPTQVA